MHNRVGPIEFKVVASRQLKKHVAIQHKIVNSKESRDFLREWRNFLQNFWR